jgi:hypothetical protein
MKICRLYMARPVLLLYLVMAAAWPMIGIFGIALAISGAFGPDRDVAWTVIFGFVIVLGIGLFISYSWLSFPYEIRANEGVIEFRSVVRKSVVPVAEIKSVRAKPYALGFVDVRHGRGTVHLISQMDGFHDFVFTIKSLNPAAKIEGC